MTTSSAPKPADLSGLAVSGTLWAYLSFLAGKILSLAATVILARLLAPEHFGVVGYCLIAIQYFDILNTFGMDTALISRRDRVGAAANAAFVTGMGISLALYAAAWAIAPGIAAFFNATEVTALFRALALVLPLSALGTVPMGFIERRLQFREKLIPDLGGTIAKGGISAVLAWQGFGAWSLILGQLAGEAAAVVAAWLVAKWRPTREYDWRVAREMLSFGGHIITVGIIGALLTNVDYILVGRSLGAAALGYYTLAYRIPELVINNLNFVAARVAHPVLAQAQADITRLHSFFLGYMRYIAMFTFPAGVGLALIASPFIRVFYTSKWNPAIAVMQAISLAIAVASVGHIPGVLYKAANRPEILTRLAWIKLPYTLLILWYSTRWGISGVAAAQIIVSALNVMLDVATVSRVARLRAADILRALRPALAGTAAMALAVGPLQFWFNIDHVAELLLLVMTGALVYLGAVALVNRSVVMEAGAALRATFKL